MSSPAEQSLGSLLRRFRLAAALSQEELADRSSVSVRTISDLERGVRKTARLDTMRLLAESLELSSPDRARLIESATVGGAHRIPWRNGDIVQERIPEQPNQLIGRSALVDEIVSLIELNETRLITLTGPGGVGKTRVAIEAASQSGARMQLPVVFVPLAPVADSAFVPVATAQALGISTSAAIPEEYVVNVLARQRLLLVLDNLEHLPKAVPFISRIHVEAPGVLMLATSRARLRVSFEQEFPVPPLELPTPGASEDEIRGSAAVRLFMERAARITGNADGVREDPEVIAEICRRVDGLPLCLELAANRLRVVPAQTLLEMLDHRMPVLTGGHRDQPVRQQSMRATIDWSYGLLDAREQRLHRWLAVYVGGFSADAAGHTGRAIGLTEIDTFDALDGLLESGLVERESEPGSELRFRMLETIREYGIEQLTEHGELDDAYLTFAKFIDELVTDGAPLPGGELDPGWFKRIQNEDANVVAVFGWLCNSVHAELAVKVCANTGMYWEYRGSWPLVADLMHRAISLEPLAPSVTTTRALYFVAGFLMGVGNYAVAKDLGEIALQMARELGDRRAVAYSLGTLGWNAELREEWTEASEYFEQALAIWEELGERGTQGQMLMFLGGQAYVRGDYAAARELEEAAATIFAGSASAVDFLAATELRIGYIDVAEQQWHDAATRVLRSLELWLTTPARVYLFQPLILAADVAAAIGEFEAAATLLGCADDVLATTGVSLFSQDRRGWYRATERCRGALEPERFAKLHAAAGDLEPADWLHLAENIVLKSTT